MRKQLARSSLRDVTDFVEFDIDPDWWIQLLLKQIDDGSYEPASPQRFLLAKKAGFSRRMTLPNVPDLVLFRAAVDLLYRKAKRREKEHVYFAQNTLAKKIRSIDEEFEVGDEEYTFSSGSALARWLEYHQYRKKLLLERTHPYIVTTDITNFFDTILYDRVADALHDISVDRNLVGLLFFILERLSIRDAFNESPRIGLPVDEFDCSRTLAHMVLFPHDNRMAKLVGESNYVRWMDDQNFGAVSYAHGLRILKECGDSLAKLHLTPNAGKSRILSLKQARRHFHLDINGTLDAVERLRRETAAERRTVGLALKSAWRKAREFERTGGEWGKVLKRFYRMAAISRSRFLRFRATKDILREPELAGRIADYMRVTGTAGEYLNFVLNLWGHEEQIYPNVNQLLMEGLLKIDPTQADSRRLRGVASGLLTGKHRMPGWEHCASIAPLLILRYGDRRSLPLLKRLIGGLEDLPTPAIAKALVAVYVSFGRVEYQYAANAASRLRENHVGDFLKMLDVSLAYTAVPERFKIRRQTIKDLAPNVTRVDMRKLLVLRFLRLNAKDSVKKWVVDARSWMGRQKVSRFDKKIIERLLG